MVTATLSYRQEIPNFRCRTQDASRKQTTAQELHSRKFISFQTQQTRRTKTVETSKITTTILTDDKE